jgi:hypothetical protein
MVLVATKTEVGGVTAVVGGMYDGHFGVGICII